MNYKGIFEARTFHTNLYLQSPSKCPFYYPSAFCVWLLQDDVNHNFAVTLQKTEVLTSTYQIYHSNLCKGGNIIIFVPFTSLKTPRFFLGASTFPPRSLQLDSKVQGAFIASLEAPKLNGAIIGSCVHRPKGVTATGQSTGLLKRRWLTVPSWLLVSTNPIWKIWSSKRESIFPINGDEHKKCVKPPPSPYILVYFRTLY